MKLTLEQEEERRRLLLQELKEKKEEKEEEIVNRMNFGKIEDESVEIAKINLEIFKS